MVAVLGNETKMLAKWHILKVAHIPNKTLTQCAGLYFA